MGRLLELTPSAIAGSALATCLLACADHRFERLPDSESLTDDGGRILVHQSAQPSQPSVYRVISRGDGRPPTAIDLSLAPGDSVYVFDYGCRLPDDLPVTGALSVRKAGRLGLPRAERIRTARWDGRSLSPWETHWTDASPWPPGILASVDANFTPPICDPSVRTATAVEYYREYELGFALALSPDCEPNFEDPSKERCDERLLLASAPYYEDNCRPPSPYASTWMRGSLYEVSIPDDPSEEPRFERVTIRSTASPSPPSTAFEYHAGAVYGGRDGASEKVFLVSRTGQRATLTLTKGDDGRRIYSLEEHAPVGGECVRRTFLSASPSGWIVARLTRTFYGDWPHTSFSWISLDSWSSTTSSWQLVDDAQNVETDVQAGLQIAWPNESLAYVVGVGNELRAFVPSGIAGGPTLERVDLGTLLDPGLTSTAVSHDPVVGTLVATAARRFSIPAWGGALLRPPVGAGQPWGKLATLASQQTVDDIAVVGRRVFLSSSWDTTGMVQSFDVYASDRIDPMTQEFCPEGHPLLRPVGYVRRILALGSKLVQVIRADDDWRVEVFDQVAPEAPPGTCSYL